jgi:two-component system, chemotaxis family, sensor kinase CheA
VNTELLPVAAGPQAPPGLLHNFQVRAGATTFAIPLELVQECATLRPDQTRDNLVNVRGTALPFLRLRELFGLPGAAPARESLVVVAAAGLRLGVVVDTLMGQSSNAPTPLGPVFRRFRGIDGALLQSDGDIALVLDIFHFTGRGADRSATGFSVSSFSYSNH